VVMSISSLSEGVKDKVMTTVCGGESCVSFGDIFELLVFVLECYKSVGTTLGRHLGCYSSTHLIPYVDPLLPCNFPYSAMLAFIIDNKQPLSFV